MHRCADWRLIEVGNGPALTLARLKIDERVLHYLAGVPQLDERLAGMVEPIAPEAIADLAPSHAVVAESIVAAWTAAPGRQGVPAVQLCAADVMDCRPVVSAAAATMGLRALALPSDLIPVTAAELDALLRLWEREAALGGAVLLVECDPDSIAPDHVQSRNVGRLIERLDGRSLSVAVSLSASRIARRSGSM